MTPLDLIEELQRFDLTARRRNVMGRLIAWQSLLGVPVLRLDGACSALAGVCGAERAFLARNHTRSELEALARDGLILLKQDAGALLVSIVSDPAMWRCSQLCDRRQWLVRINALRAVNRLQQLAFAPQSFSPNEPTVLESIVSPLAVSPSLAVRPEKVVVENPGALDRPRRNQFSRPVDPSYSHDSHSGNEFPIQEVDRGGKTAFSAPEVSVPSNSISSKGESLSRVSNSKGGFPLQEAPVTGAGWRNDGYIVQKLTGLADLRAELIAGRTKTSLEFGELYDLSPDRARNLIGDAAALPATNWRTKRPTDVLRWFNKSVSDQLNRAVQEEQHV